MAGDGKTKRKGLGGLSAEKRKMLKTLIMQKASEEMKAEARRKQEEKENHLKKVVGALELDGLDKAKLTSKVNELYKRVNALEEEHYDLELKNQRQEWEINELTGKLNDTRGKFTKPVLKKVSKTEQKLAKLAKKTGHSEIRAELKSTGQNKFALEEKEEDKDKPDWREGRLGPAEDKEEEEDVVMNGNTEAASDNEEADE